MQGGINIDNKKRKTHTSNEVKMRYIKKTYKSYAVNFRLDTDEEIIQMIENEKAKGFGNREAFKRLIMKANFTDHKN